MSTLAIVPTYLTGPGDLSLTIACLESLRRTAPRDELEVLVVDDHSPAQELVTEIEGASERLELELHRKDENSGFSRTVNIGLRRALDRGQDAVLVNADVEFLDDWLTPMREQRTRDGEALASVVGGLLLYPMGLIQHAGVFFSLLHREFDHIYRYAPANLPEAQVERRVPVTGALQFIRHECLAEVGVYDDAFRMGWEDVDYCLRVFMSGRECVYQPKVQAIHHESFFRGRPNPKVQEWQAKSWMYFKLKHRKTLLTEYVPSLI